MRCLVIGPSTTAWSARTLLVIHGDGETASSAAKEWRSLVDEGWTLLIPEDFRWTDARKAMEELSLHMEKARCQGVETDDIVVAGVRDGAPAALSFAMQSGLPWLCVFPRFPMDYSITAGTATGSAGVILLDEQDDSEALRRVLFQFTDPASFHIIRVEGSRTGMAIQVSAALEKIKNRREPGIFD